MATKHQHPKRMAAEVRRDRVMELALAGATYRQIRSLIEQEHGVRIGLATIKGDIERRFSDHIAATRHQTETWRVRQNLRIERLLTAWWQAAVGGHPKVDRAGQVVLDAQGRPVPTPPNGAALDRVLALLGRQAKLLGLDAPQQIAVAAKQVVEVTYQHVHTLNGQNGQADPAVEGTADDPRITMPTGAQTYDETGWLGENGGRAAPLQAPDDEIEDAEVVE